MAKLSTGAKVFLGVVVGTGVLWAGSALAAEGGGAGVPGSGSDGASARDVADAAKATQAFAAAIVAAGTAVSAACEACIPFVGASAAVVGTAWQNLSTRDKARIWRGELS